MVCAEAGCESPVEVVIRELCGYHYRRKWRAGLLQDRFTMLVAKTEGCWLWTGVTQKGGYGKLGSRLAHRVAWERENGPIPGDLTVDHICHNPGCVNPSHLRLLPLSENCADNAWARRTECINGHPWDDENTAYGKHNGRPFRMCRACGRERRARYRARRRGL